jgi:hypothetical protein
MENVQYNTPQYIARNIDLDEHNLCTGFVLAAD